MRLVISLESLRAMLRDLRAAGHVPGAILVSEFDKKDLKEEIMAMAGETMGDAAERRDQAIAFVEGVPVVSNPQVERGTCRVMMRMPEVQKKITNAALNHAVRAA